jgi:hypothetical protein
MREDLRAINAEVAAAAMELSGAAKAEFNRVTASALQTLALRTDLQQMKERGVESITLTQLQRLAGPDAERLMQRAQGLVAREEREAHVTRQVTDGATDRERRVQGMGGFGPASQAQTEADRDAARLAEREAQRALREAAEAQRIAREIAEDLAERDNAARAKSARMAQLRREEEEEAIAKARQEEDEDAQRERPARHRM